MKAEKFRGVDVADLQRQVADAQEQLFRFRFQMGMGQSEGLKKYRSLKLDRARMLTILREKNASEPVVSAAPAVTKASAKKSRTASKTAVKKSPAAKAAAGTKTKKAK